jgi:CHRD domain
MKKLPLISAVLVVAALAFAIAAQAQLQQFATPLTGKAETPKGSPTGSGSAQLTLNKKAGTICFRLSWKGIGTPTASHIHKGGKGVAGPIVVPLFATPPKHSGCVKVSKTLIGQISKNAKQYYVNIHTKKYPGGALRGQL